MGHDIEHPIPAAKDLRSRRRVLLVALVANGALLIREVAAGLPAPRRSHREATENHSFGGLPPARSNKRSNRSVTRFPWPGRWRGFKACARAIAV